MIVLKLTNINSPFSFDVADQYIIRNQNNKAKIRDLFNTLEIQNDTLKNHFISQHSKIENILKVSSINLSEYKLDNIENELSSIKLEKSKSYLLDFWFLDCSPCVKDHKIIAKKESLFKEKNIELIGIPIDKSYPDWKNYLMKNKYNWRNFKKIDSLKRISKDIIIWSFPTYLLLDNNGEIKGRYNSFEDFEKTFE